MKVLMLTPYLPYPPSSGGQVRSYNLIRHLAKDHQITLFSLIKNDSEKQYVKELERFCHKVRVFRRPTKPWTLQNVLRAGFSTHPFLAIRNFSAEEKAAVAIELKREEFDLIHAENFYVMPHIPKWTRVPIIMTEQTILYKVFQHYTEILPWYLVWLKPLLMIDVWKLKRWEVFYWRTLKHLTAVSQEDADHIKALTGRKQVEIIPNGVDFGRFEKRIFKKFDQPTVLFGAADFHWMQNKEAADILFDQVWPQIKQKLPRARLWVVGKIAPDALADRVGQRSVTIQEIDDSRKAYQKAWVLVAPIRSGGGSRTKFFEAMASGLPIVTTPEGIEGIEVKNGREVVVEDNLEKLVARAVALLKDQQKAARIGAAARKLVKTKYDWSQSAQILNRLYQEVGRDRQN